MTVRDDLVNDIRADVPIRTNRGGRPRRPFTATTWLLAAMLGVAMLGTLPSAALGTAAVLRTGQDSEPSADRTAPAIRHTADVTDVPGGLVPAGTAMSSAEPASAAQMRPAESSRGRPDGSASTAVQTAMAQIGIPYQWGGNGPAHGDPGFDCSGLTTFSYATAGIRLPRTAQTQYNAGPHVTAGAPLQPGDLLFYGRPGRVHHVGMYIGDGRMVNAPTFGKPVQTAYYRWRGDDYLGATRPAATGRSMSGLLPDAPPDPGPFVPMSPPLVFDAPPAPLPSGPLPKPGDNLPPEAVTAAAAIAAADQTMAVGLPGAKLLDAPAMPDGPMTMTALPANLSRGADSGAAAGGPPTPSDAGS